MSLDYSIASIMARLTDWSGFPKYQLERRVDMIRTNARQEGRPDDPLLEDFIGLERLLGMRVVGVKDLSEAIDEIFSK